VLNIAFIPQSAKEPSVKRKTADNAVIPAREFFFNGIAMGVRRLLWSFLGVPEWCCMRATSGAFGLVYFALPRELWTNAFVWYHNDRVEEIRRQLKCNTEIRQDERNISRNLYVVCPDCKTKVAALPAWLVAKPPNNSPCKACELAKRYKTTQANSKEWDDETLQLAVILAAKKHVRYESDSESSASEEEVYVLERE
jgi:hypothetical protein